MKSSEGRCFRFGVREFLCEASASLLDFVGRRLECAQASAMLSPLELLELGAVYLNDVRILNASAFLRVGDRVRIHTCPRRFPVLTNPERQIVHDRPDSLLVEKPAGLPLEATVDNIRENLLWCLEDRLGQRLYVTHRLEIESQGCALLAKTPTAQTRIAHAFRSGKIRRKYVAFVEQSFESSLSALADSNERGIGPRIVESRELRAKTSLISEPNQAWALVGEPIDRIYRLEIDSSGGRPKEVRQLLATFGSPVIGDQESGSPHRLVDAVTGRSARAFYVKELGES